MIHYRMVLNQKALEYALLTIDPEFPYVRGWVNHLIKYKGLPGFVAVWKKLKAWAVKLISGEIQYREDWFSVDKYFGFVIPRYYKQLFHVLIGGLIRFDSNPNHEVKLITKVLSILNLHHTISGPYSPDVSKQVSSAFADCTISYNHKFWVDSLRTVCYIVRARLGTKLGRVSPQGQSVAIAPGLSGTWGKFVSRLVDRYGGFDHIINSQKLQRRMGSDFMGNLTPIGDTGGKTRLILIGNPLLQSLLEPLKRELLIILDGLPTDCTFRQQDGVKFIQESMKQGKKLWSVDLKDATWNFPSSLQEEVLKTLGCRQELRDAIFRSLAHNPLDGKLHQVKKGQAMGLGPSFPLFSLCHNLILFAISKMVGVPPVNTFRVLGDDVVIADKDVYRIYRQFLSEYKVPISANKSLTSSVCAEFAGRIVFKGYDVTPIKWQSLTWSSISALYWPYRRIFPRIVKYLVDKRAVIALHVLGPIPKRIGGLNLREEILKSTPGILNLRKGLLKSILERRNSKSSGFPKIPNHQWEADGLTPSFDSEQWSFLDSLLTTSAHLNTPWGVLPALSPNPFRFLNQVGLTVVGMPIREVFSLEKGFYFRFRSCRERDLTWKGLLYEVLESQELNSVQNQKETSFEPFIPEGWKETIDYYFSQP